MKNHIISLALLVLVSLACSVQAQSAAVQVSQPARVEAVDTSVPMVATGDLWIRPEPGDLSKALKKPLHKGELVRCVEFRVIGDSFWCRHEKGWSNTKWLKGVINE